MIKFIVLNILRFFDYFHQKKIIKFLHNQKINNFEFFFDVGAHRGETIFLFSKNFKLSNIYSFEPSKINFDYLKNNISTFKQKNPELNITLENIALGNENKKLKIKYMSESSSSTLNEINTSSNYFKKKSFLLYGNKYFEEETIIQKKIFDYMREKEIRKIDFLKIDTEGYELKVLEGFGDEIKKVSIIMFEHHFHNMIIKNYKFRNINNFLVNNNFQQVSKFKMPFRKTFEYIYFNKDFFEA